MAAQSHTTLRKTSIALVNMSKSDLWSCLFGVSIDINVFVFFSGHKIGICSFKKKNGQILNVAKVKSMIMA